MRLLHSGKVRDVYLDGADLIAQNLLPASVLEADWLKIRFPAYELEARKVKGEWKLEEPEMSLASSPAFDRLLSDLANTRYIPGKSVREDPMVNPTVRILLTARQETLSVALTVQENYLLARVPGLSGNVELLPEWAPFIPSHINYWTGQ